jgi:2-methylcitrate dehydratase PrpD
VGIDHINAFDDPAVLAASALVQAESKNGAPKGWAEIEVVCAGGMSGSAELEPPSGSPDNPLSTEQLKAKFRDCAAHASRPIATESFEKMISLILDSDSLADSRDLVRLSAIRA